MDFAGRASKEGAGGAGVLGAGLTLVPQVLSPCTPRSLILAQKHHQGLAWTVVTAARRSQGILVLRPEDTLYSPLCKPAIEWIVSHDLGRVMQLLPRLGGWAASPVPSWAFTAAISSVSQRVFAARDPSPPWCLHIVLLWLRGPSFQPLDLHLLFCHPAKAIFPVAMILGPGLTGLSAF